MKKLHSNNTSVLVQGVPKGKGNKRKYCSIKLWILWRFQFWRLLKASILKNLWTFEWVCGGFTLHFYWGKINLDYIDSKISFSFQNLKLSLFCWIPECCCKKYSFSSSYLFCPNLKCWILGNLNNILLLFVGGRWQGWWGGRGHDYGFLYLLPFFIFQQCLPFPSNL